MYLRCVTHALLSSEISYGNVDYAANAIRHAVRDCQVITVRLKPSLFTQALFGEGA